MASSASERPPRDSPARTRRTASAEPAALADAVAGVVADYEGKLTRQGTLDAETVRVYRSRVRQYLAWLAIAVTDAAVAGDPLRDPAARDQAVRAYRAHLGIAAERKPSTINAHLTAVNDFYRRAGLGPTAVQRAEVPRTEPRALNRRDQLRLLRAAEDAGARDRAIAFTAYYAGTRIIETVNLDLADVVDSAREGHLVIRRGRNGDRRHVPLHPRLRAALRAWIHERAGWPGAGAGVALFLNHRGGRLSVRSAYTVLRTIADQANLPVGRDGVFTPRVLRDTAGATMARAGTDVVVVAELLGHSLETARRYSRPTDKDRREAIERLIVDE